MKPKKDLPKKQLTDAEKQLFAAQRALKIKRARNSLLDFIELMMPDKKHPYDCSKSAYKPSAHHLLLIRMFEAAERGKRLRSATSVPPQHGKSTIWSRYGTAWASGRNPHKHIIVGTYNSDFALKVGSHVRSILTNPTFKQVFPDFELRKGSKAKDSMETTDDGSLQFRGRGEGTTGNPCDMFIVDDPYKDRAEAKSPTIREEVWDWFTSVVFTRCHVLCPILIVHTRWHEDDLIGKLCDVDHPDHDPENTEWVENYRNIPAIVDDWWLALELGCNVGDALWPIRFPLTLLAEARRMNPRVFAALYMGRPTPEDGDFFTRDMIKYYTPSQLPRNLRMYGASDHAVSEKQIDRDWTVLGTAGVDSQNNIYIMDVWWKQEKTDVVVEAWLAILRFASTLFWFAPKDHIQKSIGPFLRKRMEEEKVYCAIMELSDVKDKVQKAQAIQGRMSMGKVFLPRHAHWTERAVQQLLKFPNATQNDFVDFLANLGRGLQSMVKAGAANDAGKRVPKEGTFAHMKFMTARRERRAALKVIDGGM